MKNKELEEELMELREDFSLLTSIVSEMFVHKNMLKSSDSTNKLLLDLVNKKRNKKKHQQAGK